MKLRKKKSMKIVKKIEIKSMMIKFDIKIK
jgi:hypothetical protein